MNELIFRSALNTTNETVVIVDTDLTIQFANARFSTQMQAPPEDLQGTSLTAVCEPDTAATLFEHLDAALTGAPQALSGRNILNRRDQSEQITCTPVSADGTEHTDDTENPPAYVIITARNETATGRPDESRHQMEFQDPVTGLLNRRSIRIVTDREITRADRGAPNLALLFIMLRNFKEINQMHGHTIGDLLLENTGIRIRESVRKTDYVFRWEGTNLVVLLPELATPLDALIVAEKIQSAVTVPYRFRDLDLAPACHIGIALYPTDATDAEELFNCANSAVIEAEQQQQPVMHFDVETHRTASDRLHLRTGLQRAFERGELELYYQPIVDHAGTIRGAEALMRWNHPEQGLLSPGAFIGIAEDSRLIAPIDKLALYSAARAVVEWGATHDLFVTLNISAINISDSTLPIVVSQAMIDAGLKDPSRLKLELTESRTIENREYSRAAMDELNTMGVDIWIDDFGPGQSSLSYLKHLPVTTVKIDRDFIAELGRSREDIDYLTGIINTIRSRGKKVVVEGVSSREQYELLRTLPIDYLQGFYFSKPVPAADFVRQVHAGRPLPL
ncbi:MAG: sensor domain-containing phosphodiesterase [Spirochaeta sp.]|jgi:diguanylate cyclase (GGDEF)-like protein|nr:sensor domain-containing phosphodiesterase [Spirochaeta sp.]